MSQNLTSVLNCLLNRGTATEVATHFFETLKHDELVNTLASYLNAHRRFLDFCQIESTQALNDKGVDLLLQTASSKIGFQIKSHFDVTEKHFNRNVKAQFAEALSYGLDYYYVILCCAMIKVGKNDYSMKATHLRNELSLFRKVNFTVYGPQIAATVFSNPPTVSRHELLINGAIAHDALEDHELGYEHLPEINDTEVSAAESTLVEHGDDWYDSPEGQEAFASYVGILYRKQAEQFRKEYLPTIPAGLRDERDELCNRAQSLLRKCRACSSWDDRSECKLPNWIEHVPEEMIPYTSLPSLLKICDNLRGYLKIHEQMDAESG